jgi:hypothetical protein
MSPRCDSKIPHSARMIKHVLGVSEAAQVQRGAQRCSGCRLLHLAQPDGSLRALEVVVFPESLRGFGEGHYPWDLGSSSMMTNASIANKVQSTDGQTVTVTYKGGEKTITIPANVPIVALVPADKSDIMPGAIVFVPTEKQADGTLLSGAILFGKEGVVPPM